MIEEMTDDQIDAFLRLQVVGRVGCHAAGLTYVVPVIYVWEPGFLSVYTVEGQKIRMMRENPSVCFEVDEYGPAGGWKSVIAQGEYEELAGEEATHVLDLLARRFAERSSGGARQRPSRQDRQPVAFRIRTTEVTGRMVATADPGPSPAEDRQSSPVS
jgi:nitroimidazol reductase NimA-like FMN-containing flavoprotein (pyridoxamine 5'-phosphate oxidase superfamily)